MSFDTLGLDPKLLRAIHKREFQAPTPVQAECIPKALEGKDIVARARTGSGKTLAYLLPALHRILSSNTNDNQQQQQQEVNKAGWQALILVPTRELCEQVREECSTLASTCGITVTALSNEGSLRHGVASAGNVVVATPARIAAALKEKALTQHMLQRTLRTLVLDEADLLLSYGYEEDVATLAPLIPRSCQCMLMSATSSGDIDTLSKLILHSPVSLDLLGLSNNNNNNNENGQEEDGRGGGGGGVVGASAAEIEHYRVDLPFVRDHTEESSERLLHVLAMLRLGLVHRKVLIFVNSADVGMKVKLFLDAFGIKAAVIHAELPLNSRHHILQQFNKGLFDYLIATDDVHGMNEDGGDGHNNKKNNKAKGRGSSGNKKRQQQQQDKEEEFGVTRGIDFKGVNTVINYQLPSSVAGYIHRVGRTGRAGHLGTAITLFHSPKSPDYDDEFVADLEHHLMQASGSQNNDNQDTGFEAATTFLKPFIKLTKATIDALRYRSEDVARSVTGAAIKEARAAEIKAELLNSKRLKAFFEERPSDLNLLRHDRALTSSSAAAAPHLKHLPAYLREAGGGSEILKRQGRGILPAKKRRKLQASSGGGGAGVDPVKGGGFTPVPKRGGADRYEPMTAMEKRAAEKKDKKKNSGGSSGGKRKVNEEGFVPKRNVRKHSGRKR